MDEKKLSVLALLKILEEDSDENHILSQPEILEKLESIYNTKLDRRTLYRNVEMLIDFGYDISTYSENGVGYYLRERQFEPSQIYVLCNAIHASNYIPSSASKELIDKLLSTQSKSFKSDFKNAVYVENRNKKENKEFFLNIEVISEAIRNRQSINFDYTQYDLNMNLVSRRSEKYVYSPYYLVSYLDRTYLIAKSKNHSDFTHFRIDKMRNVKISKEPYISLKKKEDPYVYAKSKIYMYSGDKETIAIKCDYSILDDVIDNFGKDITISKDDNGFIAYVKSSEEGMLYFALQYIKHLEVLEPISLREKIKNTLKEANKKYR